MKMTFRWYGPSDVVTLSHIRQIPGMSGIMACFDDKAAGEVWTLEEIKEYVGEVHKAGLECEVIESVNVHEDIKLGLPTRDEYIENYCTTVKNLAMCGIKCIVYNFMPVFDWMRTDFAYPHLDGSTSMYFDQKDIGNLSPVDIVRITVDECNGFTLPGWEADRLADLEKTLKLYEGMDEEGLLKNFKYFLDKVIPVCEKYGVVMACHPDDPGWKLFGLPRIAHSQEDYDKVVKLHDSPSNTLCLCTGSLGSNVNNDIPSMIRHFGKMNRIGCMHVRNVKHLGDDQRFCESSHLSSDGDLDMYEIMKAIYDTCPDVYIRPDHGRMIWDENGRPGYGLYDRALGATYLNGLWEAIEKSNK